MKYYTCRTILLDGKMCLKPTVNDTQCLDHVHEDAIDENCRRKGPLWP